MKKRMWGTAAGVLLAGLFLVQGGMLAMAQGSGRTVYGKRATNELRAQGSSTAAVVATVAQGDQLSVVEAGPVWLKVRTVKGAEGFISKINVSDTKPAGVGGGQVVLRDDTRAGQASRAGSIRGLSPVAEAYADSNQIAPSAVQAAKDMEATGEKVTAEDLKKFQQEGGVVAP